MGSDCDNLVIVEKKPLQIKPHLFGKYCLLERVSVGGMAEVFRAKPFDVPDFRGYLALKRILPHLAEDDEFINMFIDEAKLTVRLSHPNVIRTYELGKFQNSYYILMEYISGRDLLGIQKRMRRTKQIMDIHACLYVAHEVARGLHYAHQTESEDGQFLNLIHRDISPQNILISYQGSVKVIDFGIAKAVVQSTKTQVGVLKGKMGYMSPEQVRGNTFDSRSDLFALGTVLWEMLTNRRLFSGPNEFETMKMVQNPQVPPPSSINPKIPPAIDALIARALSADPDRRFQTGEEFAIALAPFLCSDSPQMFASWFQSVFVEELENERLKHQAFVTIRSPADVQSRLQAAYVGNDPGVEKIWDAEISPDKDGSLKDFANEHTTIQAGGFELEAMELNTSEIDILEIEDLESIGLIEEIAEIDAGQIEPIQNRTQFKQENTAKQHISAENRVPVLVMVAAILAIVIVSLGFAAFWYFGNNLTLTISSLPERVEVSVDGNVVGKTPLRLTGITEGKHLIEGRKPGFINFSENYKSSEKNQSFSFKMKRKASKRGFVTLNFTSPVDENNVFFIDGEETELPKAGNPFSLPKGRHLFEIYSPDQAPFSKIMVIEEKTTLDISLSPLKIPLSIIAPKDSVVSVDDRTLSWPYLVSLRPTALHHVVVTKPKIDRYLGFLELKKGVLDKSSEKTNLKTDYGWVMIPIAEKFWRVIIDDVETGLTTPITVRRRIPLRSGKHIVSLRRGTMSFDFHINIKSEETSTIQKDLKFSWSR